MTRKPQTHPLSKTSAEKKVERVFIKLNEERKAGRDKRAAPLPHPKKTINF